MSEDKNGHAQAQPPPHGSDSCECGDYRSDHEANDGKCRVCDPNKIWENCRQFKFSHAATKNELAHWNQYHARPAEQPAPPPVSISEMREVLQLVRKEWAHKAPEDCYATGPSTGNPVSDYVSCPGCAVQARIDAILAGAEHPSAPPQPARITDLCERENPFSSFMCTKGTAGCKQEHRAAEPSVEARQPEIPFHHISWCKRYESQTCNCGLDEALAAAKREGMEEAARLVQEKARTVADMEVRTPVYHNAYVAALQTMADDLRKAAIEEQQNG